MLHRFAEGLGGWCIRCRQPRAHHVHVLDNAESVAVAELGPLPNHTYQVSCSTCGAQPTDRCRAKSGRPTHSHSARFDAMDRARARWFNERDLLAREARARAEALEVAR